MSKTTFGGGCISPAVAAHLKKTVAQSSKSTTAATTQIGGGCVSPLVAAHLAKRNIAKK